jgi:NADPH2:quinone reductase
VVEAGSDPASQALLGKLVAIASGATYAQYRRVAAEECFVLPDGATAAEGASSFVNPLTALGMVETMRREGHRALVHTAAASSLGQMLNRVCQKDGIGLVNIVRRDDQVELLRSLGAAHVVSTGAESFIADLTGALEATGATIAFDAIGGGNLAGQILSCMEAVASRSAKEYSRYGSSTHKQVYIYGTLDTRPTELVRNFGFAWGMAGWLLLPFLQKFGPEATMRLKARVAAELTTTFATHYAKEISLYELLEPSTLAACANRATGGKFLITPQK